jgi:hypothetical protein
MPKPAHFTSPSSKVVRASPFALRPRAVRRQAACALRRGAPSGMGRSPQGRRRIGDHRDRCRSPRADRRADDRLHACRTYRNRSGRSPARLSPKLRIEELTLPRQARIPCIQPKRTKQCRTTPFGQTLPLCPNPPPLPRRWHRRGAHRNAERRSRGHRARRRFRTP